jgi:hydrogenase nickel incorporation protein HypA/HybF
MHELSICEAILRQVSAVAQTERAARVIRITLRIGPLAGVEPDLLRAAFPLVAAGTCCADVRLEIETAAVRVACRLCGAVSRALPNRLLCGACGSWRVALLEGDEMRIESVELPERIMEHV